MNQRDENSISNVQFAVLAERVEEILRRFGTLQEGLATLTKVAQDSLVESKLVQQKLMNVEVHNEAMAARITEAERRLNKVSQTVGVHANIWKIIGTGAVASAGIIGWLLNNIAVLTDNASKLDTRLTVLEYALKQNEVSRYQPQQPTATGPK